MYGSMSTENEDQEIPESQPEELGFDAVDLMLDGNLKGQIGYSMIKAVASALDEKMRILIDAEEGFEPQEEESFAEVAMPEIEAMAQAVLEGCVDFSKIHFWEACETAEVGWEESVGEDGETAHRIPYGDPLETPRQGNRILSNLEQIHTWLETVHKIHEEKGMGWVSPYGCPEDGQQAYETRAQCLSSLSETISSIKKNFDL